jgi:predicted amidohydrolase YtcJ
MIPVELLDDIAKIASIENDRIRIGSIKIFADGSLGARTAALNAPYADDKTTIGILTYSQERLTELLENVHRKGFQLAVHAIGDRAIKSVLDAFEKVLKKRPWKDHRHRMEHASVLNKKLIRRMKKLGVIASVQPHFVVSDFWMTKRLGRRRARWTYAFKSLIESGVKTCAGSDCPIEPIDPLLGIWAAVTRTTFPEERLTVDEAIRLYTTNAAFVSREEKVKGTIEKGKLADLTVLSQDLYTIASGNIRKIIVDMTIVNGEIVYARRH